jgi:hypothetical protein
MAPHRQPAGLSGETYQNEEAAKAIAASLEQYNGARGMRYSVEDQDADS